MLAEDEMGLEDATSPHEHDATAPHDDATAPQDDATAPHDDATAPHDDATIAEADVTVPRADVASALQEEAEAMRNQQESLRSRQDQEAVEGTLGAQAIGGEGDNVSARVVVSQLEQGDAPPLSSSLGYQGSPLPPVAGGAGLEHETPVGPISEDGAESDSGVWTAFATTRGAGEGALACPCLTVFGCLWVSSFAVSVWGCVRVRASP
jgi:hypothetical protein